VYKSVEKSRRTLVESTVSLLFCVTPKPFLDLYKVSGCSAFHLCCRQPNLLERSLKKAAAVGAQSGSLEGFLPLPFV